MGSIYHTPNRTFGSNSPKLRDNLRIDVNDSGLSNYALDKSEEFNASVKFPDVSKNVKKRNKHYNKQQFLDKSRPT